MQRKQTQHNTKKTGRESRRAQKIKGTGRVCDSVKLWSSAELILTWFRRASTWSPNTYSNYSETNLNKWWTDFKHIPKPVFSQTKIVVTKHASKYMIVWDWQQSNKQIQWRKELAQLLFNFHDENNADWFGNTKPSQTNIRKQHMRHKQT